MSTGPAAVRIKRKRNEPGPDRLILESEAGPQRKKVLTPEDAAATKRLQYVKVSNEDNGEGGKAAEEKVIGNSAREKARPTNSSERRVFHLTKMGAVGKVKLVRKLRSKTAERFDIATFEESTDQVTLRGAGSAPIAEESAVSQVPKKPQKRPGRGAATNATRPIAPKAPESEPDKKHAQAVADQLERFALGDLSKAPMPKVTSLPKHAVRRSMVEPPPTAINEPRIRDDEDMDMDSEGDYVYDTYVLAPGESQTASEFEGVGYLVITEEDQSVWELYIEDELSDPEWDTDDEDENAEDYYGADYPEDELASDDEYDRNAYHYRQQAGSDDEEWDEDTGAYSDDDEYERTMNPWKARTPQQFVGRLDTE